MSRTSPRLKLPSVKARSARSLFKEDLEFEGTTPIITYVPVVQWLDFKMRALCTVAAVTIDIAYCRPAREELRVAVDEQTPPMPPAEDPDLSEVGDLANLPLPTAMASNQGEAYEYTTDQPTTAQLVLVADTEGVLPIIAADHVGENWLKVTLTPAAGAILRFCDFSGSNVGTYD